MLFKLQKVPFIVVSTSASKHPSSVMVASSCRQWQPSGIGLAPVIEILTSPFMIVIMLSTLRKIKTTLTERWRHTPGGKRWRNKWFSAHCDTHTHTLDFYHYHINWWGNDVSNDMLNTGVGWGGGGCLVISSRNVHFGRRQRWGWTDDNARRWHVWTLNDLPDKVIHHIWNVLWQSPRDGSRHHPASISQKAQPPVTAEGCALMMDGRHSSPDRT